MNPVARAERNLAERETSNARDLAMTKDRPLTPEEFGDIMRRLTDAKNYLHSAAVRLRRAHRREQRDGARNAHQEVR